jgi:integrase
MNLFYVTGMKTLKATGKHHAEICLPLKTARPMNSMNQPQSFVIVAPGGHNLLCGREIMIKSFHEVMNLYLRGGNAGKTTSSRKRDEASAAVLMRFFYGWSLGNVAGNKQNKVIFGQKVSDFRAMRALEGRSIETIARDIQTASNAVKYCRRELDWDINNPFDDRKYGARDRQKVSPRKRVISIEEERALFEAIPGLLGYPEYERLLDDLLTAYLLTGMRSNELLKLERSRVKGDVAYMRWSDHKGGYDDGRYLVPEVLEIFQRQPDHKLVFTRPEKGRRVGLTQTWLRKVFARLKKKAEIDDIRIHDLRRTAGKRARMQYGLEYEQALLGHKDMSTTERQYTPVSADTCRAIRESARPIGQVPDSDKSVHRLSLNNQGNMEPEGGFEPPTYALRMLWN